MITAVILAAVVFSGGCAGPKELAGRWRGHGVIADGCDEEWRESPQYYDKDQRITIRVINDAKTLSLMVSTSNRSVQQQFRMAGLTVWFDPGGGTERIFGLHLPAAGMGSPGPQGEGGFGPPNRRSRPSEDNAVRPTDRPASLEPFTQIEITYSDTTGPLRMEMDEVRSTGIEIGAAQTGDGRLVYEFNINFSAAPSLEQLKPGMLLGIGILTTPSSGPPGPGRPTGGMGGPPGLQQIPYQSFGGMGGIGDAGRPGGGMGRPGGGNGPGSGGKNRSLEIWLKVRLADPVRG